MHQLPNQKKQNRNPASAIAILGGGARERADDVLLFRRNKRTSEQSGLCREAKTKPAIQRSDCGLERRKTFAVEVDALARLPDIQRSFLSGAGDRTRTGTPSLAVDFESTTSTIPSHRQAPLQYSTDSGKMQEKVFPPPGKTHERVFPGEGFCGCFIRRRVPRSDICRSQNLPGCAVRGRSRCRGTAEKAQCPPPVPRRRLSAFPDFPEG